MKDLPTEFWIVISEWDKTPTGYQFGNEFARGPLVHEGYCMTEEQAVERAKSLGHQYGWVIIKRVVASEVPW